MKNFSGFIGVIKNKYVIATILFLVWMLFFDPKDIGQTYDRVGKLNELQKSEQNLTNQIVETRKELDLLQTSAETIERYARENYYMKKDNEDLFIVKTP